MIRFYIENSSIFDTPPYYQAKRIMKLVKEGGGKNVRLSNYHGWSNQPKVVTFDAPHQPSADVIAIHVRNGLGGRFKKWGVFARKKDW